MEEAENVIIEINTTAPRAYEGLHDIFIQKELGERGEIPIYKVSDRIEEIGIKVNPKKVKGIVLSEQPDILSPLLEPNEETQQIANHLLDFLANEVVEGHLPKSLAPLQSGVESVANAVLNGMKNS